MFLFPKRPVFGTVQRSFRNGTVLRDFGPLDVTLGGRFGHWVLHRLERRGKADVDHAALSLSTVPMPTLFSIWPFSS